MLSQATSAAARATRRLLKRSKQRAECMGQGAESKERGAPHGKHFKIGELTTNF
jgi:hypothetical protein